MITNCRHKKVGQNRLLKRFREPSADEHRGTHTHARTIVPRVVVGVVAILKKRHYLEVISVRATTIVPRVVVGVVVTFKKEN